MDKSMKVVGTWTCKRCGAVVTEELDYLDPFRRRLPKGWEYVYSHLFCDDCMVVYTRVLDCFIKRLLP